MSYVFTTNTDQKDQGAIIVYISHTEMASVRSLYNISGTQGHSRIKEHNSDF